MRQVALNGVTRTVLGYGSVMRLLRAVAASLLWVLGLVLGLVGVILCVTIVLVPVGLAVLGYARRLFAYSAQLMAPHTTSRLADTKGRASRRLQGARPKATKQVSK